MLDDFRSPGVNLNRVPFAIVAFGRGRPSAALEPIVSEIFGAIGAA
jgi:hypothetical protein